MNKPHSHTIGINAHLLSGQAGYRQAGIHHYIAQTLRHLPPHPDLNYNIFTGSPPPFLHQLGHQIIPSRWQTERPLARIAWEQTIWPLTAVRRRLSLLHSMAFVTPLIHTTPTIITIYDLSFLHYPQLFPPAQRLYLTTQTRRSAKWARRIITISQSSKRDVHQLLNIPLDKIDVVYPAVADHFQPLPPAQIAHFRHQKQLPPRFILHVGTLQPRKNLLILLAAMAQLPPQLQHIPLFLVGGKGWYYDEIIGRVQTLGLQNRVHFIGYAPETDLPFWYNTADLLVFPSLYEGFGLPIVQALACGTPTITANISAMPEAAGNAALLFHPHNPDQLAHRIQTVLENPHQAATMRQRGLTHAQTFSWQTAGTQTAAIYRKALQNQ